MVRVTEYLTDKEKSDRPFYTPKTYVVGWRSFRENFIPTSLTLGDSVLGVSMGKVVGEWIVDSYVEEIGAWRCKKVNSVGNDDAWLDADNAEIAVNGLVPCITPPYSYPIEFYYNNVSIVEKKMNMEIRAAVLKSVDEIRSIVLSTPIGRHTPYWRRIQETIETAKNGLDI